MVFITVDGTGNPNTCEAYKSALDLVYGLSYSIKMSKKNGTKPYGYYEYVVPPLEGLWWVEEEPFTRKKITAKDTFCWTAMIRQPEFVIKEVFETAKKVLLKKKPTLDTSLARFIIFDEGLCAQIMHIGSYDDEVLTIKILDDFIVENKYTNDISNSRKHHEIYLNDPRKTAPEKLKTVIRYPIKK